jgi:hypothetical protein
LSLQSRNFWHIFVRGVAWNFCFCFFCFFYSEDFKGTVAQDFRPLFFPWINPIWKEFRVWIRTPVDSWQQNQRSKISCYCPLLIFETILSWGRD